MLFLISYTICSSSFEILNQSATAIIDGENIKQPFLGGFNYPRIEWIDLNNDNKNELFSLDEDGCLRLYEYIDSESDSFFEIRDTSYGNLCGMSWFNFRDFNQDGDLELICQSLESNNEVQLYDLIDNQFYLIGNILDENNNALISDPAMVPTFADIDSDGDYDFFTGNVVGTVSFYENVGFNNNLPFYQLGSLEWQNIWIVGPSQNRHGASALNFIDIDSDGDLDLFWGDYFQRGLYLIYNVGTSEEPIMDTGNIVSDFPYNDPIYTTGRNMPSFNDIDSDGDLDLFISVLGGDGGIQLTNNILLYENIDDIFYLNSDDFMKSIDLNSDIAPQMVDIDSDGDLDLFIGQDYNTSTFPIRGRIFFFRNIGSDNEDIFELEQDSFLGTDIGNSLVPSFSDIDSDGDLDLFIGDNSGKIYFYKNIGNEFEFEFELADNNFLNIDVGSRSAPNFIDIDLDGDKDLIVGSHNQNIKIYHNSGNQHIQNECINIPYYGLNTKPYMYFKNGLIYSVIGTSTGGLWHSQFNDISDINSDGALNIEDIILIVNYIIGVYPSLDICLADTNSDNFIDLIDIILLVNKILD